jgi:Carboxypeptidase regulatory-like domain/TonB dependent receptor
VTTHSVDSGSVLPKPTLLKVDPVKTILQIACLVVVVLIAVNTFAQSPSTGAQLSGTVTDPNGAVIRDAVVTLRGTANGSEQTTKTNAAGEYRFLLVPAGQYTLTVEAPGFGKLVNTGVVLTVGQAANLPIALQLSTAKQEVTVSAEAELVEAQRSSMATTVEQQRIDNLPINGRNYINFTLTNSQVARDTAPSIGAAPTSGLNIGGQRARSNLVNVDGEDAVDNSTNGIRSTVSQEAVQEFQIITNGYAAEYGRASGGVINIITRSGSNNFHGTAFGFLRNRNIQAVNPFSTVKNPAYTRVQTGATLSGPIKKDRTFFFFSFETTRRHETGFSSIGANNFGFVPLTLPGIGTLQVTPAQAQFIGANAALLALPPTDPRNQLLASYLFLVGASSSVALNRTQPAAFGGRPGFPTTCTPTTPVCFPLPTSFVGLNSVTGNFPLFEGTTLYSLRLDHRFSNSQQLMLRGNASPSTVTGIQVNAQGPTENFGQNAFSRTSQQSYRDAGITAQDLWTISNNKVNEFRFQYERRGLLYNFSPGPGGGSVAVNIPGFAFIGREPFSFVRRTEQRYEFTDNFSWNAGKHSIKFGADINHLPLEADFTVNFGGVYNFGELQAQSISPAFGTLGGQAFPSFNPVQAYGLGVPQVFIQGIGNPHDAFSNNTVGAFVQDSWRLLPNLTLNYGVRYDVEFTPVFPAINAISQNAQDVLGITQGIPRDYNNVAPRVGLAWDPTKDGKTVVRASYGIFYDHPLLALAFDSDVADGTQAPQFAFTGGAPAACTGTGIQNLNATNIFQGLLGCLPSSFGYLANEQRFNASLPNSVFVNENYLSSGVPLNILPFGFPTAKNFQYAYSEQAGLGVERDLGHEFALSVAYTFNGGHHLNRPIDANAPVFSALVANWKAAMADPTLSAATKASFATNPLLVSVFGVGPLGPYVPAAVTNFFRRSGTNPALCGAATTGVTCPALPASAGALVAAVETKYGLGLGVPVPFGGMTPNDSNGSSVYHGLTANLRKRFSHHYEMLASYTWSHAIDDSTDLQSPLSPQDNFRPGLERSNSLFDQRHRFVLSGVYQSGRVDGGSGFRGKLLSDWTLAPIIEASSGRPFAILTGSDTNFDFGSNTDRPNAVPSRTPPTSCGDVAVASKFSPTGFLQAACFIDGANGGSLSRNAGIRPNTYFTDLRVARRLNVTERVKLDGIMDVFNVINRFNVADVNPLYTQAGTPTAAFDPRQFQFALKLSW